ncbi:unnamed protein product [Symbiodinium microadriaticum]|nr:unnamed protein product [Symbiodinium microadriaticum]CAE7762603.1 unnamed protein product [Symbiodinium sp. KB8]
MWSRSSRVTPPAGNSKTVSSSFLCGSWHCVSPTSWMRQAMPHSGGTRATTQMLRALAEKANAESSPVRIMCWQVVPWRARHRRRSLPRSLAFRKRLGQGSSAASCEQFDTSWRHLAAKNKSMSPTRADLQKSS